MEQTNNSTRNKTQSSKMSAASSANDYEQYIKQYYIKKGDPSSAGLSFTHTRIPSPEHGVTGGTFCIPPEKLPEFWAKYSKHVITNRRHEYLNEKQLQSGGPILVDLDFRYGPHIDARQHTKDDVENIISNLFIKTKREFERNLEQVFWEIESVKNSWERFIFQFLLFPNCM